MSFSEFTCWICLSLTLIASKNTTQIETTVQFELIGCSCGWCFRHLPAAFAVIKRKRLELQWLDCIIYHSVFQAWVPINVRELVKVFTRIFPLYAFFEGILMRNTGWLFFFFYLGNNSREAKTETYLHYNKQINSVVKSSFFQLKAVAKVKPLLSYGFWEGDSFFSWVVNISDHFSPILTSLYLAFSSLQRLIKILLFIFKITFLLAPSYLYEILNLHTYLLGHFDPPTTCSLLFQGLDLNSKGTMPLQ